MIASDEALIMGMKGRMKIEMANRNRKHVNHGGQIQAWT
jgi:hypothetical protein